MSTVTDKMLICFQLASELSGVLMDQVTFKCLDFMFLKVEQAEEFRNRIRNLVPCVAVSGVPDMVSVKLFE
jgi:hypothetical protein